MPLSNNFLTGSGGRGLRHFLLEPEGGRVTPEPPCHVNNECANTCTLWHKKRCPDKIMSFSVYQPLMIFRTYGIVSFYVTSQLKWSQQALKHTLSSCPLARNTSSDSCAATRNQVTLLQHRQPRRLPSIMSLLQQ